MKKLLLTVTIIVILVICSTIFSGAEDVEIDIGELVEISTTSSATVLENKIVIHVEFSKALNNEFVSIALYEDSGRMVDYVIVSSPYGKTSTDVYITDVETATEARVFVMNNNVKYQPISNVEIVTIDRGTETPLTENERIVKGIETKKDADGDKFNVYTLLNPYTGETEEVEGSETNFTTQKLVGDVVTIKSGKVDETAAVAASHKFLNANNIWWIVGYDAEANFIEIAKFNAKPGDAETSGVNDTFDDDDTVVDSIEEIEEAGFAEYYVLSLDDATITTIGNQQVSFDEDIIMWYDLTVANLNKLEGSDQTLKSCNKNYFDSETGKIKTIYSKYLKVFVNIDWEDYSNHSEKDEDGMNGRVKFAVLIANDGEDPAYCVTD